MKVTIAFHPLTGAPTLLHEVTVEELAGNLEVLKERVKEEEEKHKALLVEFEKQLKEYYSKED
jgi:hypothetical protein